MNELDGKHGRHTAEFWIRRGVCPDCIHDMVTAADGQFCPECGYFTEEKI